LYQILLQYIANLRTSTIDGQKHNSTMVSNVSPGTATPKINKSFVHMAHVSFDRACTQDGYLKHPHPTIIDGDMRWDSGWFLCGFGVRGHWTRDQLGGSQVKKHTPTWRLPLHYGRHGALLLALPHTAISQHAARQVYVVKTRKYYCFYYLLAILRHDA
jgi:hypothetical protein